MDEKQGLVQETPEPEAVKEGVHNYSGIASYVAPTEPELLRQLEWFQDQKLALMMHWGAYSQIGLVESWALSDGDGDWSRNDVDWDVDADTFKKQYFDLNKTFNPIRFQPDKWASAAAEGGFKYFIFTTKHHDGFCMFDSKYSDYKVTAPDCPFHTHKYSNICKHLFDAMRWKGLGIGAYFSKADWTVPSYWVNGREPGTFMSRGPSYLPAENPEIWEAFVNFTHNQIKELATEYGKLDILWFDAGWVCKENGQDIRLGELMDQIREVQPWVLSADRTVGGPYENYVTPEQCVPDEPLMIPWESCITMGTSFSFKYEDTYKTVRELACLLIDIVAKGGNLALNVGPQPDGRIPEGALKAMKGLGEWLSIHGEGIYGTRVCAPYKKDGIAFTQKQAEKYVYAFKMYPDKEGEVEQELFLPFLDEVERMELIGSQEAIHYKKVSDGYQVELPKHHGEVPIGQVLRIRRK